MWLKIKTNKNSKDSEHSEFLGEILHKSFFLSKKGNLGRTKTTSYKGPRVGKSVN
jgi:hypothetical protein